MPPKIEVTIYRDRWLRGSFRESMLLDIEGHRCCLGFAMAAEGFEDKYLYVRATPGTHKDHTGSRLTIMKHGEAVASTEWAKRAMRINDDSKRIDAEREAELKALCSEDDSPFVFKFVDSEEEDQR